MAAIIVIIICIISSCSVILPTEAKNNNNINIIGFSAELIHRDSPLSPLFNPNSSSHNYERRDAALRLFLQRSNNGQIGSTDLVPDGGQYLMKMSYGTPPIESFSMIDTGSGLSWIQCLPCTHCYPSVTPPFDPKHSRTFEFVTANCTSKKYSSNSSTNNSPLPSQQENRPCPYNITYFDQSYTRGVLARETIRVGSREHMVTFPKFLFGCGHDNGGYHFPHKSAGLVGFGPDEDSFLHQLRDHLGGKFSHCLAPVTSSRPGKMSFGHEAVIHGHGVVSTPLIMGDHSYLITLEAVNVGNTTVRYSSPPANNKSSMNNIVRSDSGAISNGATMLIDTGTEVIFLPESLHIQLDLLVQKNINLRPTSHLPYTLCYPSSSLRDADIPKITFYFEGGAHLELGPANTFIVRENKRCLGVLPEDRISVFGSLPMTNFMVAYDVPHNRVSFKPMDCTRH